MSRLLLTVCATALLVLPAVPAPAPKEKTEPAGPITDEQLRLSTNNLKVIGLAIHNYADATGNLPANQLSADKKPLLSWRVQLLPFLEQDELYKQFKLDEPWDSETNKKLIEKMPKVYAPVRGKADAGMTYYQAFAGKHGWLTGGYTIANIPDGTSNTLFVAEAAKPVTWTKPDDLVFDGKDVPALGGLFDGRFNALFGDGSVRRFRKDVAVDTLKLLIDPADGTPLPTDIGLDAPAK